MIKDSNHMDQIRSQEKIEKLTQREIGHLTPRELLQLLAIDVRSVKKTDAAHSADLLSKLSLPSRMPYRRPGAEECNSSVITAHLEADLPLDLSPQRHSQQDSSEPVNRADWSIVDTMGLPITDGDMRSLWLHNRRKDRGGNTAPLSSKKAPHPKKTLKASFIVAGSSLLTMVLLISATFVELVLLSGNLTYQIVVFVLLIIILSNILGGTVKHYSRVGIDKFKTSMHLRAVKRADVHLKASQTLSSLQKADTTAYLRALKVRFSYRETER